MMRPIHYYIEQVPNKEKGGDFDTLEDALSAYRRYKKEISDFYINKRGLKVVHPEIWSKLTHAEPTENEIEMITELFYKEYISKFSETLLSDDYELN
jgi:hypothetical protein